MEKIDFKKSMREFYSAPCGTFVEICVPLMRFICIDGCGDPNTVAKYQQAVQWLYSVSYAAKFAAKSQLGKDYIIPPLEGLWWATNPEDFVARRKHKWSWAMMIMMPQFVDEVLVDAAIAKTRTKLGDPPPSLRIQTLEEGRCFQTLHVGSYDDEGPILAMLHNEIMPSLGLTFSGAHHEIYLSDPRKTPPARLKTILRQPVKPSA